MGSIRSSSTSPPLSMRSTLARCRAEAVSHVGPHRCCHLAHPRARRHLTGSLAAVGDLLGHDHRDHHGAAPAQRRRAARSRRCGADKDVDLHRRLLRLRGPNPLADRSGLLLRVWLHQNGVGQRNREIDNEKN